MPTGLIIQSDERKSMFSFVFIRLFGYCVCTTTRLVASPTRLSSGELPIKGTHSAAAEMAAVYDARIRRGKRIEFDVVFFFGNPRMKCYIFSLPLLLSFRSHNITTARRRMRESEQEVFTESRSFHFIHWQAMSRRCGGAFNMFETCLFVVFPSHSSDDHVHCFTLSPDLLFLSIFVLFFFMPLCTNTNFLQRAFYS